jgi:hypothetical protein
MRLRTNEPRQARKGAAEVAFVCAVGCLAFFVLGFGTLFRLLGFHRSIKLRFRLRAMRLVSISR